MMDDSAGSEQPRLPFPRISKDLLHYLDWAFPCRPPHPDESDRIIWMNAGKRELIAWLHKQYKMQETAAPFGFGS